MELAPEFGTLVDRHNTELLAYLNRLLGDLQTAEDCLQDTYVRALRAYGRLPQDANRRAWLYRIATNAARNVWRTRMREARWVSRVADTDADPADAPGEAAEHSADLKRLRAAVNALPYKQREALILRRYQGLDYEAIGPILGCTAQSARANAYQALKKLRQSLGEAGGGEGW
jgi:RNA polymerase sigma-70 factor (ECF subfamily)